MQLDKLTKAVNYENYDYVIIFSQQLFHLHGAKNERITDSNFFLAVKAIIDTSAICHALRSINAEKSVKLRNICGYQQRQFLTSFDGN